MNTIHYILIHSNMGKLFIGSLDKLSISFITFVDNTAHIKRIKNYTTKEYTKNILPILEHAKKEIELYLGGGYIPKLMIKLPFGTSFQKKVWAQSREIAYGNTISYKELARNINNPKSARAVGNALNKNPIIIIIPCHRIVKSNGNYGDYAFGKTIKEKLIELEKEDVYLIKKEITS